jgi:hypothetical protein
MSERVAQALPSQVCVDGLRCSLAVRHHGAVLRPKGNLAEHPVLQRGGCNDVTGQFKNTSYTLRQ